MNKTITFTVDERLEQSIERECQLAGKKRDEFISDILKGSLLMMALERAREKFAPIGEAHGYLTDEDVFRDIS